jgi:hypothetical protein
VQIALGRGSVLRAKKVTRARALPPPPAEF